MAAVFFFQFTIESRHPERSEGSLYFARTATVSPQNFNSTTGTTTPASSSDVVTSLLPPYR
jgi:hypothetical protein